MNERLLKIIIKQIESGRAVWAIFWANEYLSPEHPVRQALIRKAGLLDTETLSEIEEKAMSGLKLSNLSTTELQLIQTACQTGVLREMIVPFSQRIFPIRRRTEGRRAMHRRSVLRLKQPERARRENRRAAW